MDTVTIKGTKVAARGTTGVPPTLYPAVRSLVTRRGGALPEAITLFSIGEMYQEVLGDWGVPPEEVPIQLSGGFFDGSSFEVNCSVNDLYLARVADPRGTTLAILGPTVSGGAPFASGVYPRTPRSTGQKALMLSAMDIRSPLFQALIGRTDDQVKEMVAAGDPNLVQNGTPLTEEEALALVARLREHLVEYPGQDGRILHRWRIVRDPTRALAEVLARLLQWAEVMVDQDGNRVIPEEALRDRFQDTPPAPVVAVRGTAVEEAVPAMA